MHAPDPHRPFVKILTDASGASLDAPVERALWEPDEGGMTPSVSCPLDPQEVGIDPLNFL